MYKEVDIHNSLPNNSCRFRISWHDMVVTARLGLCYVLSMTAVTGHFRTMGELWFACCCDVIWQGFFMKKEAVTYTVGKCHLTVCVVRSWLFVGCLVLYVIVSFMQWTGPGNKLNMSRSLYQCKHGNIEGTVAFFALISWFTIHYMNSRSYTVYYTMSREYSLQTVNIQLYTGSLSNMRAG